MSLGGMYRIRIERVKREIFRKSCLKLKLNLRQKNASISKEENKNKQTASFRFRRTFLPSLSRESIEMNDLIRFQWFLTDVLEFSVSLSVNSHYFPHIKIQTFSSHNVLQFNKTLQSALSQSNNKLVQRFQIWGSPTAPHHTWDRLTDSAALIKEFQQDFFCHSDRCVFSP